MELRRRTLIGVLGPLVVAPDGETTQRPGARRLRRLLTVLAASAIAQRTVSTDELLTAIYGPDVAAGSRRALATEIWRARQILGSPEAVIGDQDGYALNPDLVDVDAARYLALLQDARAALQNADPHAAEEALTEADALWRGEPIPDWQDHPDGQALIARLSEWRLGGQEDRAEALAGIGRHREAIGILEAITQDNPYREHAWALLVECFAATEDRRRARAALDSARRILAEHGVGLGVELRAARDLLHRRSAGATSRASTLVGRVNESETALAIVKAALATKRVAAVLVSGEAGIGKTAFAEAVARTASEHNGVTVDRLGCDHRLTLPMGVVTPLLARLCAATDQLMPDVDGVMAAASDQSAALDAIATMVESAATRLGGLALVVEDIQWATPELLDLMLTLLARNQAPIALLVTQREPSANSAAAQLVELKRRASEHIVLRGLTERECAEFLGAETSLEVVATAARLSGGNPLYLRSLDHRASQLPTSLGEALDEHIDSLPLEILAVLELAAAIGTGFDSRLLVAAAGRLHEPIDLTVASAALDVATRVGVLRPGEAVPVHREFVHGLIRDRLYARSPATQRVAAHAALYAALTSSLGREAPAADIVAHHALAGWPQNATADVVTALENAAVESSRQLAFDKAHDYYRLALDLIDMDHRAGLEIDSLLAAAAQAALASADLEAARRINRALIDLGWAKGQVAQVLEGSIGLLQTYANERVDGRVLDALIDGLNLLVDTGAAVDSDLIAEALAVLTTYRPLDAQALTERILVAGLADEERVLLRVWEQESTTRKLEILERFDVLGLSSPSVRLRQWVGGVTAGTRRFDERPDGWVPAAGNANERWESHLWLVTVAVAVGDFARAERLLETAQELTVQAPSPRERASREAAIIGQAMWLAHLRADLPTFLELLPRSPETWSVRRPIQRALATFTAPALLPPDEAGALVDEIVDEFEQGVVPGRHQLAPLIALATGCMGTGHQRGIALSRELLAAHFGEHGLLYFVQYWGMADYHVARLAAASGDLNASVELFETSLASYRAIGARCFEAWNLRTLATVRYFRNQGDDQTEAVRLNGEATALASELGMAVVTDAPWPPLAPLDILASRDV